MSCPATGTGSKTRSPASAWQLAAARVSLAACVMAFHAACATKEYKPLSRVRTSFGFDKEFLKERGVAGDDSDEIKHKFADAGWKTDEDGKVVPKNPDLYAGKTVDRGRDQKKEDFYLSKRDTEKKYFRTPEYLERQQYKTKSAREADSGAREGLFDRNRANEAGRSARTDPKPGFLAGLNPFKTGTARESGATFRTGEDRIGTRGRENAVTATGVSQAEMGFYTDTVNTMDDVKKLLHPEAFD